MTARYRAFYLLAGTVLLSGPAVASNLSYTFLDFQAVENSTSAVGSQDPVPTQNVSIMTGDGKGISVGGSLEIRRFYVSGSFRTTIVDVGGTVTNNISGVIPVSDDFDLVQTTIGLGYIQPFGENFDLTVELSYDTTDYDFGSFAGEDFDFADKGIGGRVGFRWNPMPALEVYAFGKHAPHGKVNLTNFEFDAETYANVGMRWYFFEDLGVGLDYEGGEVETLTLSMRFSFGTLPW